MFEIATLTLKNGPTPASFFFIFGLFQTNIITIFTTDLCEKMSCPSSIRHRDSNPRPLDGEPPPITTRPVFFFLVHKISVTGTLAT